METIDTLLYPRWIVPIEPHNTYLDNHAIAIHQGHIKAIVPQSNAEQLFTAKETIHLKNHAVLPGLINSHTHNPMVLFRGVADDLALMDWLQNHIWPAEKKWLNDSFCYDGTQLAILEMLRSGTTCFNDHYFFSDTIGKATHEAGMRGVLGGFVIDFPTNYSQSVDEYLTKAQDLYHNWHNHALIQVSIAPHAPYSVSDATFLKVKAFAEKNSVRIHLHLHETADEINQSLQQYHKRPLRRLYELGIVSPALECVHMTQINAEDIEILQQTKAHIVHCPCSNLKLASGITPVQQLLDAKINVALGTDGAASNNDLDMFNEMHFAAMIAKAAAKDPTAFNAAAALRTATLGGAKALGLEHKIGSLESGKAADIIAVNLSDINTQPIYNPISQLVYAMNSRQVTDVWVAGKRLLKEQQFTTMDEVAILEKAKQWRGKICQD